MSDQENQNQNEEEYEEENMMNTNHNENENQEDEEGHDIYAFDIQINDDLYILVIGKTEENKILLRLMEKEDQNLPKPFFQNDFSLDDLRNIHPIFNDIGDEDIAFQYLVSTLNNSEKEIKIIDESKIKFILYVQDEDEGKIEYGFLLFKTMDEEENENENENEEMMEEGIDIDNDEINNNEEQEVENNVEINIEKEKIEKKEEKAENLPIQLEKEITIPKLGDNTKDIMEKIPEKKQIEKNENLNSIVSKNNDLEIVNTNINKDEKEKDNKNDINMMKDELLNIINNMNENFENKILVQNEAFNRMKEDIIKQSDEKIKLMNEELNKKDNEIISLKNTITNLEQKLNEYESKINDMNIKFVNLENSNKNNNENRSLRSSGRKTDLESEKKIIEIKENINIVENGIKELKKEYENDKINNENKMQILNEKINTLNNQFQSNKNTDENNELDKQKIFELDNNIKNLETKIDEYQFDQLIENIAILTEKQNDTKIFESVNNLETQLNGIKEKLDKQERDLNRNSFSKNKNNIDPEIINKINNHENIIVTLQSQLKKMEEVKNNDDNSKNKIENKLTEIIKATNDLGIKTDSLFNITQKLENENKELSSKTNNVINNVTKLSSIYNSNPKLQTKKISIENKQSKENYYKSQPYTNQYTNNNQINQYNQNLYYNKTSPNTNISSKNSFDSNIVNFEDIFFLFNRIKEINPKIHDINFRLVYRATEDGDRAADFHEKCDKIGPNIVLIKTQKGNVFGGFTFKNWEHMPRDIDENRPNLGSASRDSKAFGFNVNSQKIYNNEKPKEFAIWCNKNYGPTFKNNLFQIFDSCLKKGGYCNVRNNSHFGGQLYDYEIAGGESRFRVDELEVFEVKLK